MSNHPDCKGAHRVYADDGCNNAGCRDLDFCVEDCPSCPDHAKRLRADEKARQEKAEADEKARQEKAEADEKAKADEKARLEQEAEDERLAGDYLDDGTLRR